ncbi:hypothetical protein BU17DRAFT_93950 [Hysterangium stoloniferum]|nr:hypothetical protein BU17DRAFT_93950 [Hysterangium stoloniferum]
MTAFDISHLLPSLDGLPSNIISQIASETFLLASTRPSHRGFASVVSLCLTCRSVYSAISINDNPGMYAFIFRHLFDTAAIRRRLGDAAMYSRTAANGLKHRTILLKRIESALTYQGTKTNTEYSISYTSVEELQTYVEILRDSLLLLIENDTKNLDQLNSVGVRDFVYHVFRRVADAIYPPMGTVGATVLSLSLAVMQMLDSQENISHEINVQRTEILDFLLKFVHWPSWVVYVHIGCEKTNFTIIASILEMERSIC